MQRYPIKLDPRYDPLHSVGVPVNVSEGCWWPVFEGDGRMSAKVACPWCSAAGYLDHEIDDAGAVMPSVICAAHPKCNWHAFVLLEDWPLARVH